MRIAVEYREDRKSTGCVVFDNRGEKDCRYIYTLFIAISILGIFSRPLITGLLIFGISLGFALLAYFWGEFTTTVYFDVRDRTARLEKRLFGWLVKSQCFSYEELRLVVEHPIWVRTGRVPVAHTATETIVRCRNVALVLKSSGQAKGQEERLRRISARLGLDSVGGGG
jgi:hypothetical protein